MAAVVFKADKAVFLSHKSIYSIAIVTILLVWLTVYHTPHSVPTFSRPKSHKQPYSSITSNKSDSHALCTIESYNHGKWVYDPIVNLGNNLTAANFATATGYYCRKKFAHRCFRRSESELIRAKTIVDYRWQPESNCTLLDFNPKLLSEHLNDHPILFVGDSITQLQFESLGCLLGHYYTNRHPSHSNLNGGNPNIRVDEKAPESKETASLAFIRSDYLLRLDDFKLTIPADSPGTQLGTGLNHPWVHGLSYFDYIVLNTGPHWHPNLMWGPNETEEELLDAFKRAMSTILDYLDNHVRSNQKVWIRTTPYGHAACSQFTEPSITPIPPSGKTGEFEWHLFQQFDMIWKDILLPYRKDNRFEIFDVTTLSNLRGDAHSKPDKDCLHTCLPGPVDYWNRLLYHEIMKKEIGYTY
ncbi:GDSL/SGNH-like acyl-esterase family found in Pmr5 and Cas1p-domain-containing protein [Mycotypha africana]|uniref:GDSL/SGNH-like acyl-esterase family found in Pmr5 and Cas1p-domain-containing protein n=1 Tax=Mycotypha africana TaxID=64632 RepID=UPI0023004413|nr:GDSL/SGNH-like acyl-esterase family found in Pmr5 and Cas1p-domain-containing protein [Mycotypha africana]KAI8990986.1 GDSL/SGNH-like acyl-esterase family found in Pmr5 and Cas1p-domain-containing protein [Mycotypha africana]